MLKIHQLKEIVLELLKKVLVNIFILIVGLVEHHFIFYYQINLKAIMIIELKIVVAQLLVKKNIMKNFLMENLGRSSLII